MMWLKLCFLLTATQLILLPLVPLKQWWER